MKNKIIHKIISKNDELLFLHVRIGKKGTEFVTPNDFLLQVGYLVFSKNYVAKKHRHAVVPRQIPYTAEVLVILSGKLKYTMFDYAKPHKILISDIATSHDILILGKIGHSFKSLSDSEIIEVKQGPYLGHADKEYD